MARLSFWKDGKHSNDYKFMDRRISEMYTIGGTGILCHKYLGPQESTGSTDVTKPNVTNQSELNIQDLLFIENRDRKYDTSVYSMRGLYQVQDNSFDLSQFGLFLQTGTLFMTFHLNDMVDLIGRKLMNGDVLELPHLTDYNSLDQNVPAALKRFFVVSDGQDLKVVTTQRSTEFLSTHMLACILIKSNLVQEVFEVGISVRVTIGEVATFIVLKV